MDPEEPLAHPRLALPLASRHDQGQGPAENRGALDLCLQGDDEAIVAQYAAFLLLAIARTERLERLTELMKQPQYAPLTNAEIVCVIFAGTKGYLDKIGVKDVGRYEAGLLKHLRSNHADLLADITNNDRKVKGELEDKIKAALNEYAKDFA